MGFMGTCCGYCCAVTGGFGVLFLGTFAIVMYCQAYFVAEYWPALYKDEPDKQARSTAFYNEQAVSFAVGALIELIVMGLSLQGIFSARKKAAKARVELEKKAERNRVHQVEVLRSIVQGPE